MLTSLSKFIASHAVTAEQRTALIRSLAPRVHIVEGYDFNELLELSRDAYGDGYVGGYNGEHVLSTYPDSPVPDPLPCIAVRPFSCEPPTSPPYDLVRQLAVHLREVLEGASEPDLDGVLRHCYIQPEHAQVWVAATQALNTGGADMDAPIEGTRATWTVLRPKRFQGYGRYLYKHLVALQAANGGPPSAYDLLEHWRTSPPANTCFVKGDVLHYENTSGDARTADLTAIHKAIARMVVTQ